MKFTLLRSGAVCAAFALCLFGNRAWGLQASTTTPKASSAAKTSQSGTPSAKPAASASAMPSDAAVAAAKAKGMVWVNLNTKVYHKDDAVYGKTKNGQFMTEADAQKAGARLAKASPIGKKKG